MILKTLAVLTALIAVLLAIGWSYLTAQLPVKTPGGAGHLNPQYEYIIVGGGTAGAILASKLSADPNVFVLLLEAGDQAPWFASVPAATRFLRNAVNDWQDITEPQTNALKGFHGQVEYWTHGKALGGSSVLNHMVHHRSQKSDFDRWAKEFGAGPSWSWEQVSPYLKKVEDATWKVTDDIRGRIGPIQVFKPLRSKLSQSILEAAKEGGFPTGLDYNDGESIGFSDVQLSITNTGVRCSSLTYLTKEVAQRFNLHIVTGAFVTKINFDENQRATGADYLYQGKLHRVLINREIIVSSGTIGSPHLLLLSGIGSKADLEKNGIDVISDLPAVGQNLASPLGGGLMFKVNDSSAVTRIDMETLGGLGKLAVPALKYAATGRGILSSPGVDLIAHLQTDGASSTTKGVPDYQALIFPSDATELLRNGKEKHEILARATENLKDGFPFYVKIAALHPQSRGSVTLKSSSPTERPKIDPQLLSSAKDVETIVKALKFVKDFLLNSKSLKKFDVQLAEGRVPGCEQELWTDSYWECLVRTRFSSLQMQTSTCRMGSDKKTSVVDSHLRVHGVQGLRVVDASVIPSTLSGNPAIPVMMIAEKMVDVIKEDWLAQQ